jgi:pimeloyl-ACP methyl ester carboxylesterase
VKGTVVLLHGIMMNRDSNLPWAVYFAEKGYRVVLVDLRGHGRSTGDWIGYGAWESADLVKLADELQRRGLLAGKLGVFGISYGAAVGLQWAARDPRVATVVAVAPFSDPQQAIKEFARGFSPKLAAKLSDATFVAAEEKAVAMAGFKWSEANVLDAVKKLRVPVLFFHGRQDTWIPPAHSELLAKVAPSGSRRVVLPTDNHLSIAVRYDKVGPRVLDWWAQHLDAATSTFPATVLRE